jgi:hypothetical protein
VTGTAAMLLWYDIVPEQVSEHDEWHTREHFPERVGIPGFLSAQRWVAHPSTSPRYFVRYDVRDVATLTSPPYQARLDDPSEWTRRIMPHFRGMVRGFCAIEHRAGTSVGAEMLTIRYEADPARRQDLARWLADDCLPSITQRRGFADAWHLRAAVQPPMTSEQSLRGRDAPVDGVVLVSGYASDLLDALQRDELAAQELHARGARPGIVYGRYRFACRADAQRGASPPLRAT